MSSTVAASETTSCYEQSYAKPIYDLEKVNSSLVAEEASKNHVSDLASEKTASNVRPEPEEKRDQDVCRCTN